MKSNRPTLSRPTSDSAASPAWVVTYADLVTLLLCVFVGLFSMSAIRPDRFQTALGSLQETFGSKDSLKPGEDSLFGKLTAAFSAQDEGAQVVWTPRGVRIELAGPAVFHRNKPEPSEAGAREVNQIARIVRDSSDDIIISGHSTGEESAEDGDPRTLSYKRAAQVAQILQDGGVARTRLQVVALGDDHPALDHAYTERRRAMNRRVEIEIVERGQPGGVAE